MNSINFDGRLGADAQLRYTPNGDAVLSFSVASDIGFGERRTTNWFNCQVWGKRAEALQRFMVKGQQVTVYGQLTLREWQDREGAKRLSPDVRVVELSLQGGRGDEAADEHQAAYQPPRQQAGAESEKAATPPPPPPPSARAPKAETPAGDLDDDLPF
ncbi:single-stranded DNA-binding protein [Chromobacterium amazonense]|uniref:Single-stranded DNA-binding protein n=1 Tax=Chromobacterium amazonense TaxID=1382803 RepID=A0A2S9WYD8_9NEIS|nr:single-stranded DNA-binding protein [Chromobacterium amazonense]PRP68474.1 single-stranded DNA-binding protein [Chromobacterium amazonense]